MSDDAQSRVELAVAFLDSIPKVQWRGGYEQLYAILTAPTDSPTPAEVKPSDLTAAFEKIEKQMATKLVELQGVERRRFIDAAAVRLFAAVWPEATAAMLEHHANDAYDGAEALWAERQKRNERKGDGDGG